MRVVAYQKLECGKPPPQFTAWLRFPKIQQYSNSEPHVRSMACAALKWSDRNAHGVRLTIPTSDMVNAMIDNSLRKMARRGTVNRAHQANGGRWCLKHLFEFRDVKL